MILITRKISPVGYLCTMIRKPYQKDFKLGVLGGGQLGRMLLQEAIDLDVKIAALDPDENAPCHQIVHEFVHGSFKDKQTVLDFGKDKDLITVEIEHVNIEALKELEDSGIPVYPQPDLLAIVQDKGLQKEFYSKNNIPTAPYALVNDKAEAMERRDLLPFAQKLRKGGYDGKGVSIIRSEQDFEKAFDAPSVLEQFVDFEKELAVIVARSANGEVKAFPTVELEFNPEANLVELLFAPAEISDSIDEKARSVAMKTIEAFGFVGLLAVELFLTKDGDILVNEVAPRPHNSGHQTIEGNVTSQYAQHLRAILGLPLGSTDQVRPAGMVNLLGAPDYTGEAYYEGLEKVLGLPGVYPHLYGKSTTKPFRKMGHVTITADTVGEVKRLANEVKSTVVVKTQ